MGLRKRDRESQRRQEVETNTYVVVCKDLHAGVGPFPTLKDATKVAEKMTEKEGTGGCVYVPLPFFFHGMLLTKDQAASLVQQEKPKAEADEYRPGLYL